MLVVYTWFTSYTSNLITQVICVKLRKLRKRKVSVVNDDLHFVLNEQTINDDQNVICN